MEKITYLMNSCLKICMKIYVKFLIVGLAKHLSVEKTLELSFQNFFINFTKLLIYFKNNALASNEEGELSNKCLFREKAYCYLWHNESQGKNKKIKPIYNEIYVSWSKLNKIPLY